MLEGGIVSSAHNLVFCFGSCTGNQPDFGTLRVVSCCFCGLLFANETPHVLQSQALEALYGLAFDMIWQAEACFAEGPASFTVPAFLALKYPAKHCPHLRCQNKSS
jgi:hypothetical protein